MCELEFVGRLGSRPYHYIFTCKTHPHNFFSKEKEITVCDRAAEQGAQPTCTACGCGGNLHEVDCPVAAEMVHQSANASR